MTPTWTRWKTAGARRGRGCGAASRRSAPTQAFSKLFPNLSKHFAWILQTFPNILFAVLSDFKGLRDDPSLFFRFQAFLPPDQRKNRQGLDKCLARP
jgi:hypothetical protein